MTGCNSKEQYIRVNKQDKNTKENTNTTGLDISSF